MLIERSRYNRRRTALLQVHLLLLRPLMQRLKVLAAWLIFDIIGLIAISNDD